MTKRLVEVFSAGCGLCDDAVRAVRGAVGEAAEVCVLDMHEPDVLKRARLLGVQRLPAVALDGHLTGCPGCAVDEDELRSLVNGSA